MINSNYLLETKIRIVRETYMSAKFDPWPAAQSHVSRTHHLQNINLL